MIAACVDHVLREVAGSGLLAVTGVFALLGGTLAGWLSRWDKRLLPCAYYGFRGVSLLYLPFAFDTSFYGLPVFSIVYGLDWIASAPPTMPFLTVIHAAMIPIPLRGRRRPAVPMPRGVPIVRQRGVKLPRRLTREASNPAIWLQTGVAAIEFRYATL